MKNPSLFALSVLLGGVFSLQAQNLVTNGDFETGGAIFNASPSGWNSTINPAGTGQYAPDPLSAPLSGQVAYMETATQMFQTFTGIKLQPSTLYTVTFDASISVAGPGPTVSSLFYDVCYGVGSGGTSAWSGEYIADADLVIPNTQRNFAPITTTPQTFTYTFRTRPAITGSSNDLAIYFSPFDFGAEHTALQCFIDNVSVTATPQAPTTITYAGTEIGGFVDEPVDANDYKVENWSNAATPKTYDIGNSELYGTAGYAQLLPMTPPETADSIYQAVSDVWGGFLSATSGGAQTVGSNVSQPTFLANFLGFGGAGYAYVNFPGYSVFRAPDGSTLVRQGGISVPTTNLATNPSGNGYWGNAVYFDLNQTATFRVGIAVDTVGDGFYSADYVSIYSVTNQTAYFSPLLTRDGFPDLVFFDVSGVAGDQFAIALWQNEGTGHSTAAGYSLVTFDVITEPTEPPVLSYSRSGSNFTLSWPSTYSSWVLESSIDLGDQDDWGPVPGVVENSVMLDMTGFPKNFFRLKKN